jgi:Tol biopolymer transport system component
MGLSRFVTFACGAVLLLCPQMAKTQYFGTNKPIYNHIDFSLYQTPHFEIYHYLKDTSVLLGLARNSEKWYRLHQQVLTDTFSARNPIIVYSNHADFQQTTAIMSSVDVGTGGVTEGMKRRVIFPLTFTRQQTDHVLGHELVHAFQYHIITESERMSLNAISGVPLWMVEGMAEYLSIGPVSSHTALFMRDALIHRRFPTLETLTVDYRYSPYKFGHAFWAWVASRYGEQYVNRLFRATAKVGADYAIKTVLGLSADSLSLLWKRDLRHQLLTHETDSVFTIVGKPLITPTNGERYNIAPSISPDGKYIIFLSERDLYGLDLFLAEVATGKVISKIFTSTLYDEIDALAILDNAGTWSPDSKKFAYVGYVKGKACLLVFDVAKAKIVDQINIVHLDAIASPAWSPNGHSIVFSGLKQGHSNLYVYDVTAATTEQLTHDSFSAVMPTWSPDGVTLWFVTERPSSTQPKLTFPFLNIASYSTVTGNTTVHRTFDGARNMNPMVMGSGNEIAFLSDVDGRRNMYCLNAKDGTLRQLTQYPTGISGIAEFSPAMTIAGDTLVYSMLSGGSFNIYKTTRSHLVLLSRAVPHRSFDIVASRLAPYGGNVSLIESNLLFPENALTIESTRGYGTEKISPKFQLDYIGNMSAGIMASRFGAGMAGSIEAMFSDMLGRHLLYSALSINGEVYDFGGQVAYLKQKSRIKQGVSLSHIPYVSGVMFFSADSLPGGQVVVNHNYLFRRTFEDKISLFGFLPFNRTHRVEVGISYAFYNYRDELYKNIDSYDQIYYQKPKNVTAPPGFQVAIFDAAYVIDNSRYGFTSPVQGRRLRVQVEQYAFDFGMQTLLVDYRKYFFVKPSTIAVKLYHYGRYGKGNESNQLSDLYLGYPWYIRGYESAAMYGSEKLGNQTISINQLLGSRILVANLEWRFPLTGPREVAPVRSVAVYSELAPFIDGGIAWDNHSYPSLKLNTRRLAQRIPVFSFGAAYRVNLMGAIVIEPFYAFPVHQQQVKRGMLGINLFAGW